MNLLLVAKLPDRSLNCIIEPLLKLKTIDHIYVLRDETGTVLTERITYICGKAGKKYKLRHIRKIKLGIDICRKYRIDFIIGVLLYPHGYIGRIISLYSSIPYIHLTIAGAREFWLKGKVIERLNYMLLRNAHKISVTGSKTKKFLISSGYKEENIVTLPNVIQMNNFEDKKLDRVYDIVSVSRLDKNKNLELLLNAISRLESLPNLKVVIGGNGPELNNLIILSDKLGIKDRVVFTGWLSENAIVEIYNKSKIFVLCSRNEGFPLSLLEAMSCGCVPIVTDTGDITDVVFHGINGLVLKGFDNESELAENIMSLINNPEKIEEFAFHAKRVKSKYSYESIQKIWHGILFHAD